MCKAVSKRRLNKDVQQVVLNCWLHNNYACAFCVPFQRNSVQHENICGNTFILNRCDKHIDEAAQCRCAIVSTPNKNAGSIGIVHCYFVLWYCELACPRHICDCELGRLIDISVAHDSGFYIMPALDISLLRARDRCFILWHSNRLSRSNALMEKSLYRRLIDTAAIFVMFIILHLNDDIDRAQIAISVLSR